MICRVLVFLYIISFSVTLEASAQSESDSLDLLLLELERELEEDSSFISYLLDSLLILEDSKFSELSVRMVYTSNISTGGREIGVNQSGLNPGISYYHHSGLFGDISANFYTNLDPSYGFTTTSIGYLGTLGEKWTYSFSYDHFFFNENDEEFTSDGNTFEMDSITAENTLTNSLNTNIFYNSKYFSLGVDYSFLFGQETAHRIIPSVSANFSTKKFWIFDRISTFPTVAVTIGDQTITSQQFNARAFRNQLANEFSQFSTTEQLFIANLIRTDNFSQINLNRLERIVGQENAYRLALFARDGDLTWEEFSGLLVNPLGFFNDLENSEFGIMNYSFSLPLNLYLGDFILGVGYVYNIPIEFENEPEIPSYGYFRFSLTYSKLFTK